jgi:hypothetical protein
LADALACIYTCRVGRFWTPLPQKTMGRFGTLPTPEPSKRHTFNTVIIGAAVALHWRVTWELRNSACSVAVTEVEHQTANCRGDLQLSAPAFLLWGILGLACHKKPRGVLGHYQRPKWAKRPALNTVAPAR